VVIPSSIPGAPRVGLVLAGGAARGAYEVGVLEHIVEDVARDVGHEITFDILCGTSVGAINACCLAAWADEPRGRVARLSTVWTGLRMSEVLRPMSGGVLDVVRGFFGRHPAQATSLFDPAPLEQLIVSAIPFDRIDKNLRAGRVRALTVSSTQVATGRTVVFVQRRNARPAAWPSTAFMTPRSVRMRPIHALASSAVPLLFPAVPIHGRWYCDGGIRQNVPLSPARRLGATHMVVVNPKHETRVDADISLEIAREDAFPNPLFLLGKTLNALLLDRIDNEIDRLEKINDILDAGARRYGPGFARSLSEELGYTDGGGLRPIRTIHVRASRNIGRMCAEFVRSPEFAPPGMLGRIMKRLAEGETARENDLLSYLLFDGGFARQLVELGRHDARTMHEDLCALFDSLRKAA
jgi:NTE family protein